jgi:hypothetical protein
MENGAVQSAGLPIGDNTDHHTARTRVPARRDGIHQNAICLENEVATQTEKIPEEEPQDKQTNLGNQAEISKEPQGGETRTETASDPKGDNTTSKGRGDPTSTMLWSPRKFAGQKKSLEVEEGEISENELDAGEATSTTSELAAEQEMKDVEGENLQNIENEDHITKKERAERKEKIGGEQQIEEKLGNMTDSEGNDAARHQVEGLATQAGETATRQKPPLST